MSEHSDLEMMTLIQRDNAHAFKEIYTKYWDKLYLIAVRKLPSKDDASDVLQDLFLNIWSKRKTLLLEGSLDSYLFICLRNRIYNFYKKKLILERNLKEVGQSSSTSYYDPQSIFTGKELQVILLREVESMPAGLKKVFELSRNERLSSKMIADNLSISDQTVRNQLSSALKRIKHRLSIYSK